MAKRFRLRISRAISTTLHSCRSTDPSILPEDPVPSFPNLRIDAHGHRTSGATPSKSKNAASPVFKWQEDDKWHVVARIYETPTMPRRRRGEICLPPAPPPSSSDDRRTRRRKKTNRKARRLSTSSGDDSEWFSSGRGGEEETGTLVSSSLNFSTDSSAESRRIPARLSMLIPCTMAGKVRESYAVVKKSENPLEDFRQSMMEMIVEKQMFDQTELEQLLHCFLSLNSRHYHGVIVEAFSQIWKAVFPAGPASL